MLNLTGPERAKIADTVCSVLAGTLEPSELSMLAHAAIDFCENACTEFLTLHDGLDYFVRPFVRRSLDSGLDPTVTALVLRCFRSSGETSRVADVDAHATGLQGFVSAAHEELMKDVMRRQWEDRARIRKLEAQMETMKLNAIKFTTKRGRGWIDVGGSRMFLLDIAGGWYNLVERIILFAGEETSRRVLFDAGQAETFTTKALNNGVLEHSAQGFVDAVDTLSEAGFGDFRVRELNFEEAYARITCADAFEGWAYLYEGKTTDVPVCHFSSGALQSFMQHTSGKKDLLSTETKCIAKGDDECEFIVGKREELERQGISMPQWGMTIKERAESLENLLAQKETAEKELMKKNAELAALNKIATAVSQSLDLKEISRLAVKELRKIVVDKGVTIYLLDSRKKELTVAAQEGFSEEFIKVVAKLTLGEGLTGNVANLGVASAYDDYRAYPQAIEAAIKQEELSSLLAVPLMAKNRIVGVLTVGSKAPYHFTVDEINLFTMIGNQIGVGTDNAMLHTDLKESERKYKTLVEDINDGYFVCRDDRIVYANDAFLAMHGYDREEVLERDYRDFISPECVADVQKMVTKQMLGTTNPENLEFQRRHKDGSKLPTELKIGLSEFGGSAAIIGISRDVSERKRLQQKVLENERLASIGELSSRLAHEIRNPLSAIKMTIQILSKNLKVDGFDKKRFEIALTEIKRLDHFLQDMLHFARPVRMTKALNSLSDIVSECLDLLRDKAKSRDILLFLSKPRELKRVFADYTKMQEVFLNIFLNSMEAMPDGGEINVSIMEIPTESGPMVEVEIRDTGSGIPMKHLPCIFEPFYSTKTEGSGLGLSNVKRIVDAHNGIIDIQSTVNAGTSFKVRLPAE